MKELLMFFGLLLASFSANAADLSKGTDKSTFAQPKRRKGTMKCSKLN